MSGTDGGDFSIDRNTGELTFRNIPNFESPADGNGSNEYVVTVRATDEGNLPGELPVTIAVNDVNEAPTITGDATLIFPENTVVTRVLDRYTATDPERSALAWTLGGADPGAFRIDTSGNLYFDGEPDYETPTDSGEDNVYEIQVVATDDGNLGDGTTSTEGTQSGSFEVSVTVTPVNEPPMVSGQASHSVNENVEDFSRTYTASDPEGDSTTFTWSLSGADGGDFSINEDGELTFRNNPDHERPTDSNRDNVYEVTVRASDGRYYGTLDVVVTVNAVNEAPEFRSNSTDVFTYQENGTRDLYTYRATDSEGSDITWALSGADSSAFEISETGVLSFASPPDYEAPTDSGSNNVYQVTVEARDAADGTAQIASLEVTVTVTNVTD